MKRILLLVVLASIVAVALPNKAGAGRGATGRVTYFTATSISVLDQEVVTFAIDNQTRFTRWITQKPFQADTSLNAGALRVGSPVAVHPRDDNGGVAGWIQVATDVR